jgi:hypothetical protein
VKATELLQSLDVKTVADVLALPSLAIPGTWSARVAQLVVGELEEVFAELGVAYEGEIIAPPPKVAAHVATGDVAER